MDRVKLADLFEKEEYKLELVAISAERALERSITDSTVHKLGLFLTGVGSSIDPGQLQLMGGSEIAYLNMLSPGELKKVIDKLLGFDFPCLIVTRGLTPPQELISGLEKKSIPCVQTKIETGEFIRRLNRFLEDQLAPRISFHGVLIDVIGIGILILGQSGIGKSETALDLVLKGHRLVADDIVEVYRRGNASVIGKASDMIGFHMEIRGLGIINIMDLFGISSTRDRKRIDLVIEMMEWEEEKDYDRLGLDEETYPILGIEIPHLTIPVRPGRDLASIIEVAARNQILKQRGHNAARDFQQKLIRGLTEAAKKNATPGDEVE